MPQNPASKEPPTTQQLIATTRALYITQQALSITEITRHTRALRTTTTRHLKAFEERGWVKRFVSHDGTERFRFTDSGRAYAKALLNGRAAS